MGKLAQAFSAEARAAARAEQEAVAEAQRARGCLSCGGTYVGSAFEVHFQDGPGSRCLPGDARGQIVRAWRILYGRDPQPNDLIRSLAYLAEQTEAVRAYDQTLTPAKDTPPPDPQFEALASHLTRIEKEKP